jgi:ubiquinol-cytochrome c reductase cytochrome b subunit
MTCREGMWLAPEGNGEVSMSEKNAYDKLVDWFDVRFGFAKTWLKPQPDYQLNPVYWLGFLMATTFVMQITTGMYMTLYYVPQPDLAYSSTTSIINSVPLGHFVETLHLYTAYAMILITFMHLARNYFASSHKRPRELMWVVGVVMMLVVLGFSVTGYLLPWTIISKSATDVAIGLMGVLPGQLGVLAKSLISGTGSDASELQRFFTIHTVVLPWALAGLLALKIYMFEVHGSSYVPAFGKAKKSTIWQWFPKVFLYAAKLVAVFIAILFAIASFVPLSLPPAFNPETAGQFVVQPDWYFLSMYQVFKFQVFEGSGLSYAVGIVALIFAALILLPFYDRSKRRNMGSRPVFITIGLIAITEFIVLTVWGYLTPGQEIPNSIALTVTGFVAFAVLLATWGVYRVRKERMIKMTAPLTPAKPAAEPPAEMKKDRIAGLGLGGNSRFTGLFAVFLCIASVSLASLVSMLQSFWGNLIVIPVASIAFVGSSSCMILLVKRAVRTFEEKRQS